jgi:alpha-tubulin suppressor-like RCC1 family protein
MLALVVTLAQVVSVGVGDRHSCAHLDSGEVRCWGASHLASQKDPTRPTSIGFTDVIAMSVAAEHACVVRQGGSVWCWGRGREGELGDGGTTDRDIPVQATAVTGMVEVAAGEAHTCARNGKGAVWCWGHAACAGRGATRSAFVAPGPVATMPPATALVTGGSVTCAIITGQAPRCWGFNIAGIFGAIPGPVLTPKVVSWLAGFSSIALATRHMCVAKPGSLVSCSGEDDQGQLGEQQVPDDAQCHVAMGQVTCTWRHVPAPVPEPPQPHPTLPPPPAPSIHTKVYPANVSNAGAPTVATQVAAASSRTCAIDARGEVVCWGNVYWSSDWAYRKPRVIPGATGAISIAVAYDHACALMPDHTVRCWGANEGGGLGTSTANKLEPSALPVRF